MPVGSSRSAKRSGSPAKGGPSSPEGRRASSAPRTKAAGGRNRKKSVERGRKTTPAQARRSGGKVPRAVPPGEAPAKDGGAQANHRAKGASAGQKLMDRFVGAYPGKMPRDLSIAGGSPSKEKSVKAARPTAAPGWWQLHFRSGGKS